MTIHDLLFVGFNSRVAALDKHSGKLIWSWKSPKGSGYAAVLLDGAQLFVSVNGYTYALDPLSGVELWRNELPGMGTGVPCLATSSGSSVSFGPLDEEDRRRQSDSSSASSSSAGD